MLELVKSGSNANTDDNDNAGENNNTGQFIA